MQWFPRTIEAGRLKWLFLFRMITNTFLMATIILIYINGRVPIFLEYWSNAVVIVVIAFFGLAVVYYQLMPMFLGTGGQIFLQMLGDTILASIIIVLTGGVESAIAFLLIIVVVNSSFLGGFKISFLAATVSALAWAGIVDLHYYGYLPGMGPLGLSISSSELALTILVNSGATYLVAILGGYLSSQLDISSQALETSQASYDRLYELNDSIIQSIDTALITMDLHGRILSINRAGRQVLKVSYDEARGQMWQRLFPELVGTFLFEGRGGSLSEGLTIKHFREADQTELVLEINVTDLVDKNNESWGRLLVLQDRTAISQMQAEIKRSEHLAALGELAAGLAHEIRTPLAAMAGSWNMITNQNLSEEDRRHLIVIIGREMDRLGSLVNDFLAYARPPIGSPQAIDLNQLIEDQLHVFRSWKGEEVSIAKNLAKIPQVFFDYGQLTQVLFNLLQNAIEAADPYRGLKMVVSTQVAADTPGFVTLSVQDNGRGIPEDKMKNIFQPFYTTKPKGTGLGLATVWGIIRKGHGHIRVSSDGKSGSAFTIKLPIANGGIHEPVGATQS
ncbi:MAG: GHKL domain-containing protein [Deltaproteobacteria bacterium]|jgi:two-component system sensor histidine kinase PilS (NtrC family)|nr:GHKL domain-containing protein [Deltaproteobacteria bacterium]